jgi:hypothetical protein
MSPAFSLSHRYKFYLQIGFLYRWDRGCLLLLTLSSCLVVSKPASQGNSCSGCSHSPSDAAARKHPETQTCVRSFISRIMGMTEWWNGKSVGMSIYFDYIYHRNGKGNTWMVGFFFFHWLYSPLVPWPLIFSFIIILQAVGLLGWVISSSQGRYLNTEQQKHRINTYTHALSEIRTHDPGFRTSEDSSCLRPLGYRDRHINGSERQYCRSFISWTHLVS